MTDRRNVGQSCESVAAARAACPALLVLLLVGCKVGPDYKRPPVAIPPTYRAAPPGADTSSLADLQWFEVFKDQRLQELIRTALQQNYDLREAFARVDAARAVLGITRADQFPNITGGGSITTNRGIQVPLPGNIGSRSLTFGSLALNLLSFEVDIWGRLRRATEAARADLLAANENRKAVVSILVSDVATGYFSLLELDLELEISKRTLASRQDSLKLIRVREQGGVATLLDVRQGEQLVYGAEQQIPDIERLIEQTENQISLLLARNPGPIPRGRKLGEQEQPPAVPPGLPSALIQRRPDITAAEQSLVAANANIGVARAAYFPRITLTGAYGAQSTELANLFSGSARTWNFVAQATQPIFMAGRIRSTVGLAKAEQQIALVQYERTIQTAFREVSDALIAYQKVREIRVKQELLVTTLRDRSRLAYMRYRGGVDSLLNALDADRNLFEAELLLAQTMRDELLSLVQLYRALGGGWQ